MTAADHRRRPWLAQYEPRVPATFTPECRTANELFERGALAQPDTPAFLYFGTQISRERAAGDARALAAALRDELGLRPGDRVAVMLQNIPQLPIAFRAVWLAGGIVT